MARRGLLSLCAKPIPSALFVAAAFMPARSFHTRCSSRMRDGLYERQTRFSHRLLCPSAIRWPQMVPEGRLQLAQSSVSLQAPVEEDNGCSQPALPAVEFHPVADSYFLQRVSTPHTARHPLRLSQRVGTRLRHQHRGVEAQSKSFLFGLGVSVPLWFQTGNKQRACHRYEPLFSRAFG